MHSFLLIKYLLVKPLLYFSYDGGPLVSWVPAASGAEDGQFICKGCRYERFVIIFLYWLPH